MPLSKLQMYINRLNEGKTNFTLASEAHWAEYDIYTVEALEEYLDMECFHNVYKSEHGHRPRGYNIEQARSWLASHRS